MPENTIKNLLFTLGLSSEDSLEVYHARTRDRDDIHVLRCAESGVYLLSTTEHMQLEHYESMQDFEYWQQVDVEQSRLQTQADDHRRAKDFQERLVGKDWVEIGAGNGGLLELLKDKVRSCVGVEPQPGPRKSLEKAGIQTYRNLSLVPDQSSDICTLFHVFEHFVNPVEELKDCARILRKGGELLIEVPHAKDALLELYNHQSFKNFTFWSEHLILHTEKSLRKFVESAGFRVEKVWGEQRYPLTNHFGWLFKQQPGGHHLWPDPSFKAANELYESLLKEKQLTDTLLLLATN